MKFLHYMLLLFGIALCGNCSDYLNVVPDGTATLETAFSNRINSEKFFYSCYNYLPNMAAAFDYPGLIAGGDEIWWDVDNNMRNNPGARIALGQQNITDPYQNYWDGSSGGKRMWIGIRDCNIFLENIDNVPDITINEVVRWKAEVKILKAYFHFFLMQLYGPIPIMDQNIDVSATPEEVRVYREPVDDVIEYIVHLVDEAMPDLPPEITEITTETGRITQAVALSIKAKALVWAASPLFNGSYIFYKDFKDKRGIQLIANNDDPSVIQARWVRASAAVKDAIDAAHAGGHRLFEFDKLYEDLAAETVLKYTLRGCVTERFTTNREVIWPCTNGNNQLQNWCTPKIYTGYAGTAELSATLKMAETYYTKNGLPVDEDPYWIYYATRYETLTNTLPEVVEVDPEADPEAVDPDAEPDLYTWHRHYIGSGETTAQLNYYREPRFYAHLCFDRGIYELMGYKDGGANGQGVNEELVIRNRSGDTHGLVFQDSHPSTGYFIKKLVSFRIPTNTQEPAPYRFSMPIIRLADLYLLYAETLNEIKESPDSEVYEWVDRIRERAGLNGVVESWKYSSNTDKPFNKEGMREIIKRERLIELSFEGQRPFDLRRWRDAEKYLNEPVRGWDFQGQKLEDYYQTRVYFSDRKFTYKDYLWPLRGNTITVNSNLVQNPGW
ncbi:MAG: RagB/SusD family nutrient uptake outer membrane protein [Proteiniphilum sp.]|nr:RagB/SusD family nutrient uptake outer membrane protein [Proteiniphilum sp.]